MSSSGKGQSLVETKNDLQNAWKQAQANSRGKVKGVIIEEFINFDFEFTLLTVRKENGENIFVYQLDIFNLMETINVVGNL